MTRNPPIGHGCTLTEADDGRIIVKGRRGAGKRVHHEYTGNSGFKVSRTDAGDVVRMGRPTTRDWVELAAQDSRITVALSAYGSPLMPGDPSYTGDVYWLLNGVSDTYGDGFVFGYILTVNADVEVSRGIIEPAFGWQGHYYSEGGPIILTATISIYSTTTYEAVNLITRATATRTF